jgi:hypothetical protein
MAPCMLASQLFQLIDRSAPQECGEIESTMTERKMCVQCTHTEQTCPRLVARATRNNDIISSVQGLQCSEVKWSNKNGEISLSDVLCW